jgi:hypothetical protein
MAIDKGNKATRQRGNEEGRKPKAESLKQIQAASYKPQAASFKEYTSSRQTPAEGKK